MILTLQERLNQNDELTAELTASQRLLHEYMQVKTQIEKLQEIADDLNAQIKDATLRDGERITLGDIEAVVTVTEKRKWDAESAKVLLGDECPLTVAVDTKTLDTMAKVGKIAPDVLAQISTTSQIETLRIGKVKGK